MKLEQAEADKVALAIARVERHYPSISGIITGKIADHLALATVAAEIYGTRIIAIAARKRMEQENPVRGTATVIDMPFRPVQQ